ncbi:hypothetical protein RHGRI_034403 [Rhododendron griersonianum]|uniref:Uncharacterized protein n=1 Tax=Rhododendron griersonianum TaxID=479676 RepID=A0AAV6I3S2_9ERIC|nr:hypothetical protein RHGRI_034403 [Rhododendron griersonianum]
MISPLVIPLPPPPGTHLCRYLFCAFVRRADEVLRRFGWFGRFELRTTERFLVRFGMTPHCFLLQKFSESLTCSHSSPDRFSRGT